MSDAPKDPAPKQALAYDAPDDANLQSATSTEPIIQQDALKRDPYAAFRIRNYRLYATGNVFSLIGSQMMTIAIMWELYSLTNSAMILGLVGLAQMIPVLIMALPAGQLIDRFDRKTIILIDQLGLTVLSFSLGLASIFGSRATSGGFLGSINDGLAWLSLRFGETNATLNNPHVPLVLMMLVLLGLVRSFNQPAKQSLLPQLVPPETFNNAVTWNSSIFETCAVLGPTLAGAALWLLLLSPTTEPYSYASLYFFNTLCQLTMMLVFFPIKLRPIERSKDPISFSNMLKGLGFVWDRKVILGAISLDMFAVLLGGATALLPIYAKDILHVGPAGLGWLRAGPSLGAIAMAFTQAHMPPMKHAGRNMLLAVAGFGVATIVFGFSTNFWISMAALIACGMFDNISVVVRHTLVQTLTPDAMRGRVSAVNSIFISSSNELGAFESGTVAAAMGPVFSAVSGGVGTILVVGIIALLFPQIRKVGYLVKH